MERTEYVEAMSGTEQAGPRLIHDMDVAELFRRWHGDGDRRAREELVHRHLPLARKVASRYARTQEPFEDLVQVASLGLVKAVDRFDASRGVAFASFAVPTILGELKRYFRDKGWAIHLPRGLQELVLKVQAADAKLSSNTGRSPTVDEIALYLEVEAEHVLEALEAMNFRYASSLDAPIENGSDDGTLTRHETVGSDEEGYALAETSASLAISVGDLPAADREVLTLRFKYGMTQRQIAEQIGVSQMQVSRILRRITNGLRETMDIGCDTPSTKRRGNGGCKRRQ
jgi:RNA polymerase sigma-B factor